MNSLISRVAVLCLGAVAVFNAVAADPNYPQKSNLPTLYIETENRVAIPSKDSDYVRATLHLVDGDEVTVYDELGIRGRGNSTWGLAKKPYRIKFDKKQEFLGPEYAKAKSWTLLANHADKTLMRNAVAACIGRFAGQPFTAAAQFVDLVLNGQYVGCYQISDQIEVRSKRVDITEQEEGLSAAYNISGGYLLEVDGFATDEPVYFKTNRGVLITIKSPDDDVISSAQKSYIQNYINSFERALFASNFKDPDDGYRQYVDESTLASWYISSELTGNVDCFWSTYIYKEKDDPKIYWGPLWDYDIAFNNCNRTGEVTNSLMMDKGFGDDLTKVWMRRMWQDPWFANLINDRWKELVAAGIEKHVLDYIDAMAEHLEASQRLNYGRWRITDRVYNEIALFGTYSQYVDYLKKFVTEHIAYLTMAFERSAATLTPPVPFESETDYYYTISNKNVISNVDVDSNGSVCIWTPTAGRYSQHWRFVPDGKGYYQIINRDTNLAIADDAKQSGNGYSTGSQLSQVEPDAGDSRQLWSITPAGNESGMGYVIANSLTGLAWNNSEGKSNDGNPLISWNNDKDNPSKPNRQWYITRTDDKTSGIETVAVDDVEYYISYDPTVGMLHFRALDGVELNGTAAVVSIDGKVLMQFVPAEDVDISSLSPGYYVLSWQIGSKAHSLKFTVSSL